MKIESLRNTPWKSKTIANFYETKNGDGGVGRGTNVSGIL